MASSTTTLNSGSQPTQEQVNVLLAKIQELEEKNDKLEQKLNALKMETPEQRDRCESFSMTIKAFRWSCATVELMSGNAGEIFLDAFCLQFCLKAAVKKAQWEEAKNTTLRAKIEELLVMFEEIQASDEEFEADLLEDSESKASSETEAMIVDSEDTANKAGTTPFEVEDPHPNFAAQYRALEELDKQEQQPAKFSLMC